MTTGLLRKSLGLSIILLLNSALYAQNLGVGEPTPASKLSVKGNLSVGDGYSATAAPANGAIIEGQVSIGTATPATGAGLTLGFTNAVRFASGTTAQRPASPQEGFVRYNTDLKTLEFYDGSSWVNSNLEQVPVGTIIPYAGATIPSGWLACDGGTVSRTTYADLFAAIGVTWGSGDGSTTFHLPDLRGRFLRGVNSGSGRDPDAASRTAANTGGNTGDNVGSIQGHAIPDHGHNASSAAVDLNHTHNWGGHWSNDNSASYTGGDGDGNGNTISDGIIWWGGAFNNSGDSRWSVYPSAGGGGHSHTVGAPNNDVNSSASQGFPAANNHQTARTSDRGASFTINTSAVGNHAHNYSLLAHRHWLRQRPTTGSLTSLNHSHAVTVSTPIGTNITTETRPRNANVQYIIKASKGGSVTITSANIPTNATNGQTLVYSGGWTATSSLFNTGTRIGVGTDIPQSNLSVAGNTSLGAYATTNAGPTNGLIVSGNVGIGTPTPTVQLDVAQNQAVRVGNAFLSSGGDFMNLANNAWYNGSAWTSTGSPGVVLQFNSNVAAFFTHNGSGTLTPRVTINNNGRVGIGTTTPNEALEVNGAIRFTTDASSMSKAPRVIRTADVTPGCPGTLAGGGALITQNITLARPSTVVIEAHSIRYGNGRRDLGLRINGGEVDRCITNTGATTDWQTGRTYWVGTLAAGNHIITLNPDDANIWGCGGNYGSINTTIFEQ
jgi:microcystin-dependent protein